MNKLLATLALAALMSSVPAHAGYVWNGLKLNGYVWNGFAWNGVSWNSRSFQGTELNGTGKPGTMTVFAVTLPEALK